MSSFYRGQVGAEYGGLGSSRSIAVLNVHVISS